MLVLCCCSLQRAQENAPKAVAITFAAPTKHQRTQPSIYRQLSIHCWTATLTISKKEPPKEAPGTYCTWLNPQSDHHPFKKPISLRHSHTFFHLLYNQRPARRRISGSGLLSIAHRGPFCGPWATRTTHLRRVVLRDLVRITWFDS